MATPNGWRLPVAAILVVLGAWPTGACANPLYRMEVTDGASHVVRSYSDISDAFGFLRRRSLNEAFRGGNPAFDADTSAIVGTVRARGILVRLEALPGSSSLTIRIPAIGLTRTFTGASRDESARAMLDWFYRDGEGELAKLSARLSPVDPLAGNPNSAQARTVSTSFDRGFSRIAALADASAGEGNASDDAAKNANTMSMGAEYRRGAGPYGRDAYTLPLGYSWRLDDDVRHAISLDLPVTYQSVQGAQLWGLGAGLGYSRPLNDYWVLTAGLDYGMAASQDLGTAGHVLTGSLTSVVTLPVAHGYLAHVGNMVGYSQTLGLRLGDFQSDPGLKNTVIRNGLMLYAATPGLWRSSGIEVFAIDTRYLGSALYDMGYTEVGVSFGRSRVTIAGGKRYESVFRLGVSRLFARGNNTLVVNTGYMF